MKILVGWCYYILAQGYSRNNKLQNPNSNPALSDSSDMHPTLHRAAHRCGEGQGWQVYVGCGIQCGEKWWGRGDRAWLWSSVHVRSGHPELEHCSTGNGKTICVSKKASGSHLEIQGPVGAQEFQSWYSTVAASRVWSQKACISVLVSSLKRCVTSDYLSSLRSLSVPVVFICN